MNNRDKNIVGQILAKTYRIERFLGVGTVGTVYVARHVRSGGLYAVKLLHRKLAASPDLYQRFQDEARLIATLRHPHILPITDFDRDENGIPFFVMDLLEGENLQQRLKHKETLPIAQSMEIVQQVGSALHTAHRSGIVHRNIKPENVFLVRHDLGDRVTETAKVMDFGLARFRRMAPAGTRDASLGVSAYMAPEMLQETNTPIDGRADQWALAVIAYRMLTGKPPFEDENPEEMLRQIINEPPRPFPKMTPELPAHLAAAIHRGMAKRREDRYETMMDFVRALSSRPSSAAGVETVQAPGSGRVNAPMPPIPSGAVPPPTPAAAQAPRPMPPMPSTPSKGTPVAPPTPAAPAASPSRATPAPAAAPSAASPPQPPPILHAPPLLIPEEAKAAPPPPPRGPSWGLLIGGGALALMAGVGATLLWEQRQHPRPPITAPIPPNPPAEVGTGQLVVEPLVQPPPAAAPDAAPPAAKGPVAPHVPVPPLRAFGDDTAPTPATPEQAAPATNPAAPATNPAAPAPTPAAPAPAAPAPAANPTQVPQPVKPPAGTPVAATSPSPVPQVAPRPTPPQPVPGAAPIAQPAQPIPQAAPPGPRNAARDEVDELIGPSGPTAPKAQPTQPPPAAQPAVPPRPVASPTPAGTPGAAQRPTMPQRPPAKQADPEADSGEKSADKLLEDAQASYVRGERQRAIELALQVTKTGSPTDVTKAWRFIGSAACSVRSAPLATRAYQNLPTPEHRQLLSELCKRNGLNLVDGQFIAE